MYSKELLLLSLYRKLILAPSLAPGSLKYLDALCSDPERHQQEPPKIIVNSQTRSKRAMTQPGEEAVQAPKISKRRFFDPLGSV
jgi:hypothetical protein